MSDHIYRITAIGDRMSHGLECVGHDSETCPLQSWWENAESELLDLKPLNIAFRVHAKPWGEDDGPTIELAEPADPIVWDGTDEALAAIKGDGLGGCWKGDGYKLWPVPDMEWAILLPDERSGWSVVTTSSGPVILPPKEVTE